MRRFGKRAYTHACTTRARWKRGVKHGMRRIAIAMTALLMTVLVLVPAAGSATPGPERLPVDDTKQFAGVKDPSLVTKAPGLAREVSRLNGTAVQPAAVGDTRFWLGLDDYNGEIYVKQYTLRGVGNNAEVWVASDEDDVSSGLEFPIGDCRNSDGLRTVITDAQVEYLIDEFDNNMYPRESALYSVPPPLDGMDAPLAEILGLPSDYYAGAGDRIVVLVDNFRDDNFYDTNNANTYSYIAGFYWSLYDYYFNRLTMNIDGWDWLHRTGDNPPNDPSTDPCTHAPSRPDLYEGVFAHEYQHLLENYRDSDEVSWVNEGLLDVCGAGHRLRGLVLRHQRRGVRGQRPVLHGVRDQTDGSEPLPVSGGSRELVDPLG